MGKYLIGYGVPSIGEIEIEAGTKEEATEKFKMLPKQALREGFFDENFQGTDIYHVEEEE